MKKQDIKNSIKVHFILILQVLFLTACSSNSNEREKLEASFVNPPNEAKPRVWWHWMNGNVTKDGIRKDLIWMHESGIGGFQNFDAGLATPQIVNNRLNYMTPQWKEAFHFTTILADSLNLEMAIAGSPGWSESGGPWVAPEDGMKKIVWSERRVEGGKPVSEKLPQPPKVTGAFQNLSFEKDAGNLLSDVEFTPPQYYEDIAVVAYQIPSTHLSVNDLNPQITSSGGSFKLEQLTDGDLNKFELLPYNQKEDYAWIQFEFSTPQTIKGISVVGGGNSGMMARFMGGNSESRIIEASNDGKNFKKLANLPAGEVPQLTVNFKPERAKFFRVSYKNPVVNPLMGGGISIPGMNIGQPESEGTEIAELVLYPYSIIDRFEEKAGYSATISTDLRITNETEDAIGFSNVIDLTNMMSKDGTLNWIPPAGNWKIIRFGYSLTGKENHPASLEATGLEVDKMDTQAVKRYFENYLEQYKDATNGMMGEKGLQYIITDSYEAGQANWTPNMAEEFMKRRGYSMIPWLPVITGKIVKSTESSERFLWDFRKTIAELAAESHYDNLTIILDEFGMKRYSESHENGRAFIADGMDVKRNAAVPMSACWVGQLFGNDQTMYEADIRESASVAHIYGQNLVAAESFTAMGMLGNAFSYHPENLKPTADLELASGLNRFVIHTSVHQPVDDKIPGLGLSIFGQWFTRHETWAAQAKVWTDYLARSSYLLQQGKFVADVVYYYGEDNNITNLFGSKLPDIPNSYSYDFINPDALINLLTVKNGRLVTPSEMSYSLLYLDKNAKKMSLTVLRKIKELVDKGAVIGGTKPEQTPSLTDDVNEFNRLVKEIWESGNQNVYEGKSVGEMLEALKISPDFEYSDTSEELRFVHRSFNGKEIYWISNRSNKNISIEATFRVSGKVPQIWYPETGKIEQVSYKISDNRTSIPLQLVPDDAIFVVFDKNTKNQELTLPEKKEEVIMTVEGSWNVSFQPDRGAPENVVFEDLHSYTEEVNQGIKYFSGTALYRKSIDVKSGILTKDSKIFLDLGDVANLAEVVVNGKNLGVVWKKPFKLDITGSVKAGENMFEIKVTNLWVNRLIGDQQPDMGQKVSYTTIPFYRADSPLIKSGLLGPVRLYKQQ